MLSLNQEFQNIGTGQSYRPYYNKRCAHVLLWDFCIFNGFTLDQSPDTTGYAYNWVAYSQGDVPTQIGLNIFDVVLLFPSLLRTLWETQR